MNTAVTWICATKWRQALLLIVVSAAIFLPGLGSTGLSMSEGHRAIPAWEMLNDARAGEAHWLVPRMFETAYLRKPPGMLWAIAGSSAVFGETEFAARFPSALSATLLGLAVWWFATRWFGSPWGLAAGLAQVLLPVTWPSARSAEIESLHVLTAGVTALLAVDIIAWTIPWAQNLRRHAALSLAFTAVILTKGLAGAPFCVAALAVGSAGTNTRLWLRGGLAMPALVIGGTIAGVLIQSWFAGGPEVTPAVRQGVESFMWERGKALQIIALGPAAFLTMLPASLAFLFPWGPDIRRERAAGEGLARGRSGASPERAASVLAWALVLSAVLLTTFGVSNPRYGLPACALVTPLVAYVARGAHGTFVGKRPAIARAMLLGRAWMWPVVLLIGAAVYVGVLEPHRRASSGREAGIALAAALPNGAEVWADEMIEARPEVLYYAVREAAAQGRSVRVRWLKPSFLPGTQPDNLLLLLREDELVDEVEAFGAMQHFGTLHELARGHVHKYTFVLVEPAGE